MVLNSRNFSKRLSVSNSENTPPSKAPRPQSSHLEAARRRRARILASAASRNTHTVAQARRRHMQNRQSAIRFEVAQVVTPPHTPEIDARQLGVSHSSINVTLPRLLPRPAFLSMPDESNASSSDLEKHGDVLWNAIRSSKMSSTHGTTTMPTDINVTLEGVEPRFRPTHVLGVYPSKPAVGRPKLRLYASHNFILAANCGRLPHVASKPISINADGSLQIPFVPLRIPSPDTFPLLSAFLYTKLMRPLFSALLPPGCNIREELQPDVDVSDEAIEPFGLEIAQTYTSQAIYERVRKVIGIHMNAVALGVADKRFWDVIDLAWEVLLSALAISTGLPKEQWPERVSTSELLQGDLVDLAYSSE